MSAHGNGCVLQPHAGMSGCTPLLDTLEVASLCPAQPLCCHTRLHRDCCLSSAGQQLQRHMGWRQIRHRVSSWHGIAQVCVACCCRPLPSLLLLAEPLPWCAGHNSMPSAHVLRIVK